MSKFNQDKIVTFLKTYGFVFSNSEIYGGLANAWDYGPLGVLLKNNLKNLWWKEFVTKIQNSVGLDSAILSNARVWKASGHLAGFSDPLLDCKDCKQRFRADKLIEEFVPKAKVTENTSLIELNKIIKDNKVKCPNCHSLNFTDVRKFNLMFKTYMGVTEDSTSTLYLRPETCQSIFVDFNQIARTSRQKLPFSVCQIGKAFRNEITPGNFIFRTREFEQAEIEYFTKEQDAMKDFEMWLKREQDFLLKTIGINKKNIKLLEVPKDELAHYSKRTVDILYNFPHGFSELWGCAHRGVHDLTSHMNESKKDLSYTDPTSGEKIIPNVIEPSVGVDRLMYAIVCDMYDIEMVDKEEREVLRLPISLAPYKFAVLPLSNKLDKDAHKLFETIVDKGISCAYDASGSIGKRYRRQDAIGTPYCITFDFDSLEKKTITVRNRDSMKQETIKISDLNKYIFEKLN
ncbi:MAG: glycine--tRNA ligase [Mycoplasmoidaceae bacterium]|nr:MAG: glycine--tRNA ligase [Mycoplasmoidaceae bacterium]